MDKKPKVACIIDEHKLQLNIGHNNGVTNGQIYLIYSLSTEEIFDPDTHESLGFLEIVRGTGKVTHVQDKMCTIESNMYDKNTPIRTIKKQNNVFSLFDNGAVEEIISSTEHLPFNSPKIGDFAKRITY